MTKHLIDFWRNARSRAIAGDAKPPLVQVIDALELSLTRGLGPRYYETAGLWRKHIDRKTMRGHINVAEYRAFIDRMNPKVYRKTSQHKIIEKALLTTMQVPTAKFLGFVRQGGSDGAMLIGDVASFERMLLSATSQRFAFKEVEGFGGRSFRAFQIEQSAAGIVLRSLKDGCPMTPLELWQTEIMQSRNGFIAEEYIDQHPWYAALNNSSVNTFRVWVVSPEGGSEVILSYLRMGRGGNLVDNKTAGGILAPVDADGRLGMATDASTQRTEFAVHPDSGAQIAGEAPPLLDEVHKAAIKALGAFPGMRFAGVDVAVSTDGPKIVELNVEPAREGAVRCDLPFKTWLAENGF